MAILPRLKATSVRSAAGRGAALLAITGLAITGALLACQPYTPRWSIPDGPPAYRAGFEDGCLTAQEAAREEVHPLMFADPHTYRDEERFQSDGQYRSGWEEGYEYCFQKESDYQATRNPGNGFR